MKNILIEASKYIIIIMAAVYTLYSFLVFQKKDQQVKRHLYSVQGTLVLIIHFIGYMLLYLQYDNDKLLFLYLAELGFFLISSVLYQKIYNKLSMSIFNHMQFFLAVSFVILARLSWDAVVRQFAFAAAATILCLIIPFLIQNLDFLDRLGWIYGGIGIILLGITLLFGKEKYGAKNWISLKIIGIQPSEFVKLLFIFSIAALLASGLRFKKICAVSALAAVHVIILVVQNDLGGALIFFVTYVLVLYVATGQPWYLFGGLLGASAASIIAYQLFYHVRVRVMAWKNPWSLIDNQGFQIAQSLFAIGTGGWFGMGLGKGLPDSIPVVMSDFIFSGIAEEMGTIFAICIILIYLNCFFVMMNISIKMKQPFHKLASLGFSIMYVFQIFLSVGGSTKLIPSTGVTLPLISYGGSSLTSTILMFSIFQGLYLLNNKKKDVNGKSSSQPASSGGDR